MSNFTALDILSDTILSVDSPTNVKKQLSISNPSCIGFWVVASEANIEGQKLGWTTYRLDDALLGNKYTYTFQNTRTASSKLTYSKNRESTSRNNVLTDLNFNLIKLKTNGMTIDISSKHSIILDNNNQNEEYRPEISINYKKGLERVKYKVYNAKKQYRDPLNYIETGNISINLNVFLQDSSINIQTNGGYVETSGENYRVYTMNNYKGTYKTIDRSISFVAKNMELHHSYVDPNFDYVSFKNATLTIIENGNSTIISVKNTRDTLGSIDFGFTNVYDSNGDFASQFFSFVDQMQFLQNGELLKDGNNIITHRGTGLAELYGRGGDDTIKGGAGIDGIWGGLGADKLTGGGGEDIFFWDSLNDFKDFMLGDYADKSLRDIVTDFRHGIDKIDLTAIDANATVAGNQDFILLTENVFQPQAGTVWFDNGFLFGDVNGGNQYDFAIQLKGCRQFDQADLR